MQRYEFIRHIQLKFSPVKAEQILEIILRSRFKQRLDNALNFCGSELSILSSDLIILFLYQSHIHFLLCSHSFQGQTIIILVFLALYYKIKMRLIINKNTFRAFCTSIQKYGLSSRIGGSSSEGLYEIYAGKYKNQAIDNIKNKLNKQKSGISVLTTPQQCIRCVDQLKKVSNIVAWDTETIDLDIKNQSPVGNGKIICASFFAGPEFNFGNGPKVFIDNFGANAGLINYFKEYLEDQKYLKVWHNYGFDRHVFMNHGINVRGFGGDTLHMARLYDASLMFGQYALSSLTKKYKNGLQKILLQYISKKKKMIAEAMKLEIEGSEKYIEWKKMQQNLEDYMQKRKRESSQLEKTKLQSLFRRKKILNSGVEGKTYQFPSTLTMHTKKQHVEKWVNYSVLDSEATFFLRQAFERALSSIKIKQFEGFDNVWKIYQEYWRPFGELLTDMERQGFKINIDHMNKIEQQAIQKIEEKKKLFMSFLMTFQKDPNIDYFNPTSHQQMQQLLHAPYKVDPTQLKKNKQQNQPIEDKELSQLVQNSTEQQESDGRKLVKRQAITELPLVKQFKVSNNDESRGNAKISMHIVGLGIPPVGLTAHGLPSVDEDALVILAGNPKKGKYGKVYDYFKKKNNEQFGKKLSQALETLIQLRQTETLLQTFIQPLKTYVDSNNRIHCSLNINTQTGRLSSKKPNLQNQPALEKDIYKIRSAFTCQKGNKLIVADYGQLQLRVLAHISNCKKMIQAFKDGGDFHSRTAIGMFDYIKKDIDENKVLLEWDKSKGDAPVPLLKQKYASERRKAKTVNFSIAYGKTPQGFAEDWNCKLDEAKEIIKAWFKDRPEVKKWQEEKQDFAKKEFKTFTLLGRERKLDRFFKSRSTKGSSYGMGLRRAINTPIQGGAADIVIASMVKIHNNQELRKLGWKLILQIHDQLILEGPEQHVMRAFDIVKDSMSHPFQKDLLVQLQVDAKIGQTWYQCK